MLFCQELTNDQKNDTKYSTTYRHDHQDKYYHQPRSETQMSILDYLKILDRLHRHPFKAYASELRNSEVQSDRSTKTLETNGRSITSVNKSKYDWNSFTSILDLPIGYTSNITNTGMFGFKETSVYMTLSDEFSRHRTSSTQATASINKCFQVYNDCIPRAPSVAATSTDYCSTCTISTLPRHGREQVVSDKLINPNVYFWGRKKDERKVKGMGPSCSQTRLQKTNQTSNHAIKTERKSSKSSIHSGSNTSVMRARAVSKPKPVKSCRGGSTNTGSSKTVTIKDEKQLKPCPTLAGTTKGDMMVTISHIRIGPKETCPVHENEPCQGPKCVLASSGVEQGPVKVTTVNNPRRGVFEIVVRKLTGAPLAKNELMLEWTPPLSRPPTCGGPCITPCLPPGTYRPSKCKLVVCRTSSGKPKWCKKKPCGRVPCGRVTCGVVAYRGSSCKSCSRCFKSTCCSKPCSPCKPCPPPLCYPPAPCTPPPCKSSPCLRPCPVGRKQHRKTRSQPKIKSYRKKISPCCNRSKTCPVVRCRSVPNPCVSCCIIPPVCLPRRCCSVVPCKLPKPCVSACSSCCG